MVAAAAVVAEEVKEEIAEAAQQEVPTKEEVKDLTEQATAQLQGFKTEVSDAPKVLDAALTGEESKTPRCNLFSSCM